MQKIGFLILGLVLGAALMWAVPHFANRPDVDPASAARGKTFYQVCAACHGPHAMGNPANQAPRLRGQHPWYLIRQLKNFRAGIRGVDGKDTNGLVMRPMSLTLPNDQAVEDVVAYISTL